MYGTDVPFNWPVTVDLVLNAPFLSDADKEAILSGNLMKLLRIVRTRISSGSRGSHTRNTGPRLTAQYWFAQNIGLSNRTAAEAGPVGREGAVIG